MLRLFVAAAVVALSTATSANASVSGWLTFANDRSRTGFVPQGIADPAALRELWSIHLDGRVTTQVLVARDVPAAGETTAYVATSKGVLYALDQNGQVRASRQLGFMHLKDCEFLPDGEFGITGAPVIDSETATLYVTDALGAAHALDLVTLEEREGWPVQLYSDPSVRLTWGAVTLVRGKLYVGTGELCRRDVVSGKLFSVDLATRRVEVWAPTPRRLGGGSGIWGWGGPAYDAATDSLLVATGDAYRIGANRGKRYRESAGLAESLIQLNRNLRVKASHGPLDQREARDFDFTGTPIVMRAPGCPALVAGENKNGVIYVWRLKRIGDGLYDSIRVAPNLNGQPAWSPRTRSLYVGGHDRLIRLVLTRKCRLRAAWSVPFSVESVNGPPTVAGDVVWFPATETYAIWAIDARSGSVLWSGQMGEAVFTAPTVLDGRVYAAGFSGVVKAFG